MPPRTSLLIQQQTYMRFYLDLRKEHANQQLRELYLTIKTWTGYKMQERTDLRMQVYLTMQLTEVQDPLCLQIPLVIIYSVLSQENIICL